MKRMYRWLGAALLVAFVLVHIQNQMEKVSKASKKNGAAQANGSSSATAAGTTAIPRAARAEEPTPQTPSAGDYDKTPINSPHQFSERFPGGWSFDRNSRGRIRSISGGLMNVGLKTPQELPAFVQMLAPLLDVPPAELLATPVQINGVTDASKTFELKQTKDGLEVYGGMIRIHTRSADGAVYIVDNLTWPVSGYNKVPAVTQQQAAAVIQEKFGTDADVRFNRGPVIFANTAAELAWVFNVTTIPQRQGLVVVVGASSGQILSEQLTTHR